MTLKSLKLTGLIGASALMMSTAAFAGGGSAPAAQAEPVTRSAHDATAVAPADHGGAPHWSYEGGDGPKYWGDLAQDFALCSEGSEQSPINLDQEIAAYADPVQLFWNSGAEWTVANNGHTIQVNTPNGGLMTVSGKDYELLQFHFHAPSEHAINGKRSPMEVHFVHKAHDGALAVVGVMLTGGGTNTLFDAVMSAAPRVVGESPVGLRDPNTLLPSDEGFYRYQGSLTTPPCSETVLWTVMNTPVRVSDAQIEAFMDLYEMNARPLQEANRRFILYR